MGRGGSSSTYKSAIASCCLLTHQQVENTLWRAQNRFLQSVAPFVLQLSQGRGASLAQLGRIRFHPTNPTSILPSPGQAEPATPRSEEHTSELQSRLHLVCRLLLEK